MVRHLSEVRKLFYRSQPVCARQICRTRMGCRQIRNSPTLPGNQTCKQGCQECTPAVLRTFIRRKRGWRSNSSYGETSPVATDNCRGRTRTQQFGAAERYVGSDKNNV